MHSPKDVIAFHARHRGVEHVPAALPALLAEWTDGTHQRLTVAIRTETDDKKKDKLKARLRSQVFGAELSTEGEPFPWKPGKRDVERYRTNRNYLSMTGFTGCLPIEWDKLGVTEAYRVRDRLLQHPSVLAAKVSSSEKGTHSLVWVGDELIDMPVEWMQIEEIRSAYLRYWIPAGLSLSVWCGLEPAKQDHGAKDAPRVFYANHDADAGINWKCEPFDLERHVPSSVTDYLRSIQPAPKTKPAQRTQATGAAAPVALPASGVGRFGRQRLRSLELLIDATAPHCRPGSGTNQTVWLPMAGHIYALLGQDGLEAWSDATGRTRKDGYDLPYSEPMTPEQHIASLHTLAAKAKRITG